MQVLLAAGVLACAHAGCVRAGFGEREGDAGGERDGDAGGGISGDTGGAADGSTIPTVTCGDWTPGRFTFDYLGVVAELSAPGKLEAQPQLSYDGLHMTLARDYDLLEATRSSPGGQFGAPTPISGLATSAAEVGGFITEDRLTAYVMLDDPEGVTELDIWLYGRASTNEPFKAFRELTELNTALSDWDPFLAHGGQQLYGARVVDSSYYPIWVAQAAPGDGFGPPQTLVELDTLPLKGNPSLTYDQKIIVFNGAQADRDYRLYYATRSGPGGTFGAPVPVPGLDAAGEVGEPFVTADGCELYFTNQAATGEDRDVHRARYRAQ
jgi:hypothetical protein